MWAEGDRDFWNGTGPLPFVVSPAACVYRQRAINARDRAHREWRVAYTCGSLAGSVAAVKAGLGITVLPKGVVPADLPVIDGKPLPNLKDTEISLLQLEGLSPAAARLKQHVIRSLR